MKKTPAESFPLGPVSTSCGQKCFEWLINPQAYESFISSVWEKKPLVIKRADENYLSGLISRRTIENYVKNDPDFPRNSLILTKTSGEDNEIISETDIEPQSFAQMLDEEGWSCQVMHPQQKNAKLHALLERLENWSGSLWGSNFYFGSNTSESEPLSDNFELFILQTEGRCHWKVFEGEQKLSRDSGSEYNKEDLGPTIVDDILEAGDLLYIPRGYIHSYRSTSNSCGYLTLSTYQTQSRCDLLSTAVTETLEKVTRSSVELREGLPINWTSYFGSAIESSDDSKRSDFTSKLRNLMHSLIDAIDIDDIADQIASDFIALRTPPVVRKRPADSGDHFGPDPRQNNDLRIRIRNPAWMRVVVDTDNEESKLLIFSCLENEVSRHMKTDNPMEAEPTSIEIVGTKSLPGLKQLIMEWPNWCPLDVISRDLAGELWEANLVETSAPTDDSKKPRSD